MTTETITANVNAAKCIVEKTHFGYDTFLNICTGAQSNVDWTTVDYLVNFVGFSFFAIIALCILVPVLIAIAALVSGVLVGVSSLLRSVYRKLTSRKAGVQ